MKLRTFLSIVLATYLLANLVSCFDPEPGEVGMRITLNGSAVSCNVLVFNPKGKQIQQEHADQYGVVYVKKLPPGEYTFKFSGHSNEMYPAVRTAKVTSGGSAFMEVDLNQATDPNAPPPAA
jgi:hypothetical protein